MKGLKRITILASVILFISTARVFAGFNCTVGMYANTTMVKGGDTVSINVTINNITLSENSKGITMFDGYLNYDESIFEDVNVIAGSNKLATYMSTKRVFVELNNDEGLVTKSGETMFTITMKVKENANFDTTTVSLTNISITDNYAEISTTSSVTFSAIKGETTTEEPAKIEEQPRTQYTRTVLVKNNDKDVNVTLTIDGEMNPEEVKTIEMIIREIIDGMMKLINA